jgi:hypothetical protein
LKARSYLFIDKKLLLTIALTQPLAVEPCGWGLRGVAAQCFVVNRIFNYYYSPQLATNNLFFRTIFTKKTTIFDLCKVTTFSIPCYFFMLFFNFLILNSIRILFLRAFFPLRFRY